MLVNLIIYYYHDELCAINKGPLGKENPSLCYLCGVLEHIYTVLSWSDVYILSLANYDFWYLNLENALIHGQA